jgi:mono/diheme cytochrome c family protein
MPPAGEPVLTADQIAVIRQWILEGANNTTNCSGCDTTVFTYSGAIKSIMHNNCVVCHSGTLQNGGVDLSNYTGAHAVAVNGKLIGTITHAAGFVAMPQGANKLSNCNITQIQKWIDAGAQNN